MIPMFNLPLATTNYGTYTPYPGTYQPVTYGPIPQINIPGYSPQLQIPTAPVIPQTGIAPKLANPTTALPGQQFNWSAPSATKMVPGIGAIAQLINPQTPLSPMVAAPKPAVITKTK